MFIHSTPVFEILKPVSIYLSIITGNSYKDVISTDPPLIPKMINSCKFLGICLYHVRSSQ